VLSLTWSQTVELLDMGRGRRIEVTTATYASERDNVALQAVFKGRLERISAKAPRASYGLSGPWETFGIAKQGFGRGYLTAKDLTFRSDLALVVVRGPGLREATRDFAALLEPKPTSAPPLNKSPRDHFVPRIKAAVDSGSSAEVVDVVHSVLMDTPWRRLMQLVGVLRTLALDYRAAADGFELLASRLAEPLPKDLLTAPARPNAGRREQVLVILSEPRRTGEIADALGIASSQVTRALRQLEDEGAVVRVPYLEAIDPDTRARWYVRRSAAP